MYVIYYLELKKQFFDFSEHDREVPFCTFFFIGIHLSFSVSSVYSNIHIFIDVLSPTYLVLSTSLYTFDLRCQIILFFGDLLRRNGRFSVVIKSKFMYAVYCQMAHIWRWACFPVSLTEQEKKVVFPFGMTSTIGNIGNVEEN